MRWWWMSCKSFTVLVGSDERDIVRVTAPITKKFEGQHIKRLADWMRELGDFEYEELEEVS